MADRRSAEHSRTATEFYHSGRAEDLLLTKELPEFTRNLTEKMLTYALGRGRNATTGSRSRHSDKMEKSDYRFQTLVREIVDSLPFQARRGQVSNSRQRWQANEPDHEESTRTTHISPGLAQP